MTTDYSSKIGWQGEDLPDAVQGLILMRKFAAACAVMAGNFQQTYEEVTRLLNGCEPQEVSQRLQLHPFYRAVVERLSDALIDEDSSLQLYRLNAQELYELVRGSTSDTIIYLVFAMWVTDGADLPPGLMELVKKVEEADELGLIPDLTDDSEEEE